MVVCVKTAAPARQAALQGDTSDVLLDDIRPELPYTLHPAPYTLQPTFQPPRLHGGGAAGMRQLLLLRLPLCRRAARLQQQPRTPRTCVTNTSTLAMARNNNTSFGSTQGRRTMGQGRRASLAQGADRPPGSGLCGCHWQSCACCCDCDDDVFDVLPPP